MNSVDFVIADLFEDFIQDWDYSLYLGVGSYGSGKSYAAVQKIILKCFAETRKVMVVRETYESLRESCFDLFKEVLEGIDMLRAKAEMRSSRRYVLFKDSPMTLYFPNGSKIIFKGLDKVWKQKSVNGVTIVWIEECTEIKQKAYTQLVARCRHPKLPTHFILTCNPVGQENWVYKRFFADIDEKGNRVVKVDDEQLYEDGVMIAYEEQEDGTVEGVYMHHSVVTDNPFASKSYIRKLDNIKKYDPDEYRIGRLGRFGVAGKKVLPQFRVATQDELEGIQRTLQEIPQRMHFTGFDFGFEESYNAVVRMAVDEHRRILYIYDELYENNVTDDIFMTRPLMQQLKEYQHHCDDRHIAYNPIVADSSSPKDIRFYAQQGWKIRKCMNRGMAEGGKGTRIANTKKMKRFHEIVCLPNCINVARELGSLTYHEDRNGELDYSQFNIDPHTFSAMWYGLDIYDVPDPKQMARRE